MGSGSKKDVKKGGQVEEKTSSKPSSPVDVSSSKKKENKKKGSAPESPTVAAPPPAAAAVSDSGEDDDEEEAGDEEKDAASKVDPFSIKYEEHTIGYETDSWAVRKYRTNEMSTARRGLDDNIQEFLEEDLGFIPDHSYEDVRLWIMAASLAIGVYAHSHDVPFAEAHYITLTCIFGYYFCVVLILYIGSYLEGDQLLVAKKKKTSVLHPMDRSVFKGNWVLRLMRMHTVAVLGFLFSLVSWMIPASVMTKIFGEPDATEVALKHKLRVRSDAYMFLPKYSITIELVSPGMTFLTKPKVFHTVTEEWSIGEFFDKEGYIYPPALKRRTYKLLKQVMDKAKKD